MKRALFLFALSSLSAVSFAMPMFELKIENVGPQPLSPLFWTVGNSNFDLFQLNGTASLGIKNIAEGGNTAAATAIAVAAGSDLSAFGTISGGPVMPGQSRTTMFSTTTAHQYLSFASMLGMTNDGFIGESLSTSRLDLFGPDGPQGFRMIITGLRAWDAGTELNTQSLNDIPALGGSGNPADTNSLIRIHDTIIPGLNQASQLPDWNLDTPLAVVTVTPVPEPATMAALGVGVLALLRRRKR